MKPTITNPDIQWHHIEWQNAQQRKLCMRLHKIFSNLLMLNSYSIAYCELDCHIPLLHGVVSGNAEVEDSQELFFEGQTFNLLVSPSPTLEIEELIIHLTEMTLDAVSSRLERENLVRELNTSWESLDSLYEFASGPPGGVSAHQRVERIFQRILSIDESLAGMLSMHENEEWNLMQGQQGDAKLEMFMTRLEEQTLLSNYTILFTADTDEGFALGLKQNDSLLLVPVKGSSGVLGVFLLWSDRASTVFTSRVVSLIETLAIQAGMIIENHRMYQGQVEGERLRNEMKIGAVIQQTLLQEEKPANDEQFEIAVSSIASRGIDGDFYDFIRHDRDVLDIVVGDVMGKGLPAALIGAATKSQLMRHAATHVFRSGGMMLKPPSEIVGETNRRVAKRLISLDSFLTLFYTRFDFSTGAMTYVDAGHTKPLYFRQGEPDCRQLDGENVPLGFLEDTPFNQNFLQISPNDLFVFYSDGVTEVMNKAGVMFGVDRLKEMVFAKRNLPVETIINCIIDGIRAFAECEHFNDDLTLMVLRVSGSYTVPADTQLVISSSIDELQLVRNFVAMFHRRLVNICDDEAFLFQLQLAVNEAIIHIIERGFEGDAHGKIHLDIRSDEEKVIITTHDNGSYIDINNIPEPVFDGSGPEDFRIYLLKEICDEIHSTRLSSGQNQIIMIKYLETENGDGNGTQH